MRRRWPKPSRRYAGLSVALAICTALLLNAYARRVGASAGSASGGVLVTVLVAGEPIARGERASADRLELVRIPAAYAPPGALSSMSQAAGRVALTDLLPGEAVTQTRLARVRAGPVASLVPEGLRAFAVPTSLPPGTLEPGDHVDVLATYGSGQPHTETVVEGVEVLLVLGPSPASAGGRSAGLGLDAAAAGVGASPTLILLVSVEQEARLAFARAFADLQVAIAPPPTEGVPVMPP